VNSAQRQLGIDHEVRGATIAHKPVAGRYGPLMYCVNGFWCAMSITEAMAFSIAYRSVGSV
jgi:hypothetical protein